jgi:hypothetical protein
MIIYKNPPLSPFHKGGKKGESPFTKGEVKKKNHFTKEKDRENCLFDC